MPSHTVAVMLLTHLHLAAPVLRTPAHPAGVDPVVVPRCCCTVPSSRQLHTGQHPRHSAGQQLASHTTCCHSTAICLYAVLVEGFGGSNGTEQAPATRKSLAVAAAASPPGSPAAAAAAQRAHAETLLLLGPHACLSASCCAGVLLLLFSLLLSLLLAVLWPRPSQQVEQVQQLQPLHKPQYLCTLRII